MTKITLLDGGMGQELVHRTGDRPTPLWSTQVMLDHPGLVAEVHRDFADAGATVATVNSYAIHRDRLEGTGLEDRFTDLHKLAQSEVSGIETRIAGSIGPLVASYRPDFPPSLRTTRKPLISMSLSTALVMSYTVNAATDAAVNASISTPVLACAFTIHRTAIESSAMRKSKSTVSSGIW